ncbi:MAG: EthD family reductase [Thermomicrobiales bacterium]|nr:EthD family reductase [Thermomicrobiales bacterium]
MFTVVWLVKKRPDLSPEAFTRYWIEEHTPITAAAPGMRAYRCYPMIGHDGAEPAFDAIAFASFDDEAAWRVAEQSPAFQAAIADAVNFQDVANTQSFYADEYIIR